MALRFQRKCHLLALPGGSFRQDVVQKINISETVLEVINLLPQVLFQTVDFLHNVPAKTRSEKGQKVTFPLET